MVGVTDSTGPTHLWGDGYQEGVGTAVWQRYGEVVGVTDGRRSTYLCTVG